MTTRCLIRSVEARNSPAGHSSVLIRGLSAGGIRHCRIAATGFAVERQLQRTSVGDVLQLRRSSFDLIVDLAIREYPLEACGLISGPENNLDMAVEFHPCRNVAASARVYELDPLDHMTIERDVERDDREIIGVVHSHTHSEPYPSPTDVAQAPDPGWHYVIVSLKREGPELRSYRIIDGTITEEPVDLVD